MGEDRDRTIIRTSVVGIIANVALAAFKAFVGIVSGSVAIVLDAVNNLSDALSSLITIVGTKLAAKAPDRKHPLGYGRIEYLTAAIISVIVLYAGTTSLVESVRAILEPQTPDYATISLLIVGAAVAVKVVLGLYVRGVGRRVDSDALVASGSDALFDSIISASTLVAAIIFITTGLSLEAWLGAVISLVIIKSGVEMLRDTLSEILGERVGADLANRVREVVLSHEEVMGVFDLIIHSYGPSRLIGSLHISVPGTMTAVELDRLERRITYEVYEDCGVIVGGISIYATDTDDEVALAFETRIRELLMRHEGVIQMHGFFVDHERRLVGFDVVLDFAVGDLNAEIDRIRAEAEEICEGYRVVANLDYDTAD